MPLIGDDSATPITPTFGFSAVDMSTLGASEYTLVAVTTDCSGSVSSFRKDEEKALGEIVLACQKSPRADNLLYRLTRFDHNLAEIHGFKPLPDCNPKDYVGCIPSGGSTALFDATVNAVESVVKYGKELVDNDFTVNGIVFVITDGGDNASTQRAADVKNTIDRAVKSEALESIITILIGVNVQDPYLAKLLADFAKDAGFTPVPVEDPVTKKPMIDANGDAVTEPFVNLADASAKTLAKLANFISKSISSQSQALGTGGPSQSLSF
jgi:uncharacterized protein YegL